MKLMTFIHPTSGTDSLGIVRASGVVDVAGGAIALGRPVPAVDMISALTTGPQTLQALDELADACESSGLVLQEDTLGVLPPVRRPSKFFCVGKNSKEHRQELIENGMLNEIPAEPTGFIKLTETMVGQDAPVPRPDGISTLDYEPELVFMVGQHTHRPTRDQARRSVVAFTLFNDVTAREVQKREAGSGTRFWTAKNMPGFAPIGPYMLTLDEVVDPFDLWMTCHVNGQLRLRESTGQYIFKIDDAVEHFARYVPFFPGDLIAMGAPKGVAMGQPNAADLYLRPGDKMEIAFEGIMSLRNPIVAAPN